MKTGHLVYVGAQDWKHPSWQEGFYPADLPDDWLLSYYNTQFQAVYLPVTLWQSVSDSTWSQWLNDTQAGFVFVLEPGEATVAQPASGRVVQASREWEAEHIWWWDERPDLRALSQRITQQAASGEPLFVFSRKGDIASLEKVSALKQVMGY